MPHSSQAGWTNAGAAAGAPAGVTTTAAISIAAPSWSIPLTGTGRPAAVAPGTGTPGAVAPGAGALAAVAPGSGAAAAAPLRAMRCARMT